MSARVLELFSAYRDGRIPPAAGYIVSSFMVDGSAYARYEIVACREARTLRLSADGLTIAADASKVFVLVEPAGYHDRSTEPWRRDVRHRVPHTFAELAMVRVRDHSRIMVSNTPVLAPAVFTVVRPAGIDFSFLFLPGREAPDRVRAFLEQTLQDECLVPAAAARRAANLVQSGLSACHVGARPW